jgi:hypothetical protein
MKNNMNFGMLQIKRMNLICKALLINNEIAQRREQKNGFLKHLLMR